MHQDLKRKQPLKSIEVHDRFEIWGIDLIGPLNTSTSGNKYICVAVEYASKWAEVVALPTKEASGVSKFLMQLVHRFGVPKQIISDRGTEFCNTLINSMMETLNIRKSRTSAYHPQTNGLTERTNQTLFTALSKCGHSNDWDQHLDSVVFSYRVNKHSSTGMSPFQALYGRDPRLPFDAEHGDPSDLMEEGTFTTVCLKYYCEFFLLRTNHRF